jgi:hypothetical protein
MTQYKVISEGKDRIIEERRDRPESSGLVPKG